MSKLLIGLLVLSLATQSSAYHAEIETFRRERAAAISGETGWAALTDLRWLAEGRSTLGRSSGNHIVLNAPSAPARIGSIVVANHVVTLHVDDDVPAKLHGRTVQDVVLKPDAPVSDAVTIAGLTLAVIDRGGKLALRVWDRMSSTRVGFHGLRWYPIAERWRIMATFEPHQPPRTVRVQNIVGQIVEMANPGAAVFSVGGKSYRLEALIEEPGDRELFFMFRDATSNKTTYGAGRYLYTPLPANGGVLIDFNRAMNPPCAFTKFATCPLPPKANTLGIPVDAGELNYGE